MAELELGGYSTLACLLDAFSDTVVDAIRARVENKRICGKIELVLRVLRDHSPLTPTTSVYQALSSEGPSTS
jgi:hypothetical protein